MVTDKDGIAQSYWLDGKWVIDAPEQHIFPSRTIKDWRFWASLVEDGDIVEMDDGTICHFSMTDQTREHVKRWASGPELEKYELMRKKPEETAQIAENKPKVGDVVLCRDYNNEVWGLQVFAKYRKGNDFPVLCLGVTSYVQCAPVAGNEDIIGTAAAPNVIFKFE